MIITRHNVEQLLDSGQIEVLMKNDNWWKIRRNGKTQKWKNDPERIRIPVKMGLYGHESITEDDFKADGTLDPANFRLKDEGESDDRH